MNKTRNNELIKLADKRLRASNLLMPDGSIPDSYNGSTAALGVSVAMSGLLPTLAIYYQDFDPKNPDAPCRRNVLNVVATMIPSQAFSDARELLEYALSTEDSKNLANDVIDCAIALKQVIRTYNLVKQ